MLLGSLLLDFAGRWGPSSLALLIYWKNVQKALGWVAFEVVKFLQKSCENLKKKCIFFCEKFVKFLKIFAN